MARSSEGGTSKSGPSSLYPDPANFDVEFHAKKRVYTEAFLVQNPSGQTENLDEALPAPRVLLGRKKRGFKAGLLLGYGGKVEPQGATVAAAAVRELEEESGVRLDPVQLQKVGVVYVQFREPATTYLEIHAFRATVRVVAVSEIGGKHV